MSDKDKMDRLIYDAAEAEARRKEELKERFEKAILLSVIQGDLFKAENGNWQMTKSAAERQHENINREMMGLDRI
jgi:hypothetical protein